MKPFLSALGSLFIAAVAIPVVFIAYAAVAGVEFLEWAESRLRT